MHHIQQPGDNVEVLTQTAALVSAPSLHPFKPRLLLLVDVRYGVQTRQTPPFIES